MKLLYMPEETILFLRKDIDMNTNNKIYAEADDIVFDTAGEKELSIINKTHKRLLMRGFKKRAIISVIIGIIIAFGEVIGRINQNRADTITGMCIFIIVAVLIFNLLSYGYIVLKRKMDFYTDKVECLYCTVTEKYNQHKLSKENQKHAQNYILLESEKYHCTTAFPIKGIEEFNKITIGDTVLLLKSSPYGDVHYEVLTDIN